MGIVCVLNVAPPCNYGNRFHSQVGPQAVAPRTSETLDAGMQRSNSPIALVRPACKLAEQKMAACPPFTVLFSSVGQKIK